jgi:spermidine synthase
VLCFLASGASGLIYQVVWMRELVLVFGATTPAVSTVLAAFMGGLAAGSFWGGRLADRSRRPLLAYALLEFGIAGLGLFAPLLFAVFPQQAQGILATVQSSPTALLAVRFLLASTLLFLPTCLMGATLPLLARHVTGSPERAGRDVGMLYAVNTAGAVGGAAAAGFLLIPVLGLTLTNLAAAALNVFAGVTALVLARTALQLGRVEAGIGVHSRPLHATPFVALCVATGASGLAALVCEVAWTRSLTLVLGGSVYAFSAMLATFLFGLAAGSALGAWLAGRCRSAVPVLAAIEIAIAAAIYGGLWLIDELPYLYLLLGRALPDHGSAQLAGRSVVAASVMLVPTLLFGMAFPVALRAGVHDLAVLGRRIGALYASNTVGAILGACASGFLLIPSLGVQLTLVSAAGASVAAAACLTWAAGLSRRWSATCSAALVAVLVAAGPARPRWDPAVMSSAIFRYAASMKATNRAEFLSYFTSGGDGETIFYRDGVTATVTVQQQAGHFVLKVNGKPDASTAGDLPTQSLLAHLPLLLHAAPRHVLVVGWGSGVTAGAALTHPVNTLTAVELEPAVVEASQYFDHVNHQPLADPRTKLVLDDGRNLLATTRHRFDVIISEPSNPWLTGVANLFTREYFELGARCLAPDGLFSQWLQIYEMPPDDLRCLLATFTAVFPNVTVFRGASGDLILIGSARPTRIDAATIAARVEAPGPVREDLHRIAVGSAPALLSRFVISSPELPGILGGVELNTDDNAVIEFRAPLRVGITGQTTEDANLDMLERAAGPVRAAVDGLTADDLVEMALGAIARGDERAAVRFVNESLAWSESARGRSVRGELYAARGRNEEALTDWMRAVALDPQHVPTRLDLGKYFLSVGNGPLAVEHLRAAVRAEPGNARAHHLLGVALQFTEAPAEALAEFDLAARDGEYLQRTAVFALHYGRALRDVGRYQEARSHLEAYVMTNREDVLGHVELANLYLIQGDVGFDEGLYLAAEGEYLQALTLDEHFAPAYRGLSMALRKQGRLDEADAAFQRYQELVSREE